MKVRKRKTTLGILREGRRMIASGHWTQGVAARDARGRRVAHYSEEADSWCAFGACWAVAAGDCDEALVALNVAVPVPRTLAPTYNDAPGRTQAEIVALFDRAIENETNKG